MKAEELRQVVMSVNASNKIERSTDSAGSKTIRGYAVVFDDIYTYKDFFTGEDWQERVDKNAFEGVNLENVLHLRDHDYSRVLGRTGKNTRIEIDEVGLFFETVLPDTELAKETYTLIEAEICDQCSFGFTIKEYKRNLDDKIDTIMKIDQLFEITITPIPAYKSTVVTTMSEQRNDLYKKRTAEYKNKMEVLLK